MPISRGSIRHSITEDIGNTLRSILCPGRLARRATAAQRSGLSGKIRKKFGYENVLLFPYARTAFHAILKSLKIPKNSEILLTPITIGPMLEVITALGHKPVFVDIELETFCVDLNDLKSKLESKPACFLLTYLFGYVPDIESIAGICRDAGIPLIEDISHNIGSRYNGMPLGSFGTAAIYSASLLKYVDGYNGAFVATDDKLLAERLEVEVSELRDPDPQRIAKIIRTTLVWNICLRRIPFALFVYPLLWLIKKFNRKKFEEILGARIKFLPQKRLPEYYFEDISSIQCETISSQLDKLDKIITSRNQNARMVAETGQRIMGATVAPILIESDGSRLHTFWQFVVPVNDLTGARDALFQQGVETGATNLMNLASLVGADLPRARRLKENFIFVPIHGWITNKKYYDIFNCLKDFGENEKR
jgi:dTDP-4-amino-4,6-dideoxygalactose transaminase